MIALVGSRISTPMSHVIVILTLLSCGSKVVGQEFIRGDCLNDGQVNIADATQLLGFGFQVGFPQPSCLEACEADGNSTFNSLVDGLYIFDHVFGVGPPPPAPYPSCGTVPMVIGCDSFDCSLNLPAPNPKYELNVSSGQGTPGDEVDISVALNFPTGAPVWGISFAVCSDPDLIEPGIPVLGADTQVFNLLTTFLFASGTTTTPTAGWTFGMVTNMFGVNYLPPQDGAEVAVSTYHLVGPPGATATLTLCETGDPVVNFTVTASDGSLVVPTVSNGQIDIIDISGAPNLLRGDCDGDLLFNGLADPLFALNFVFSPGSDVPPCVAQCDADGDGGSIALADALHMLNFAFIPGSPPIPPPYPDCDLESGSNSVGALGCDNPVCP